MEEWRERVWDQLVLADNKQKQANHARNLGIEFVMKEIESLYFKTARASGDDNLTEIEIIQMVERWMSALRRGYDERSNDPVRADKWLNSVLNVMQEDETEVRVGVRVRVRVRVRV